MIAREGSEFCTIAASRGLVSRYLASHGATFLISLYDTNVEKVETGTVPHKHTHRYALRYVFTHRPRKGGGGS